MENTTGLTQSPFVDVEGAAKYLLVEVGTIYRWIHNKKQTRIPVRHHGRRVVFLIDELRKWSDEVNAEKVS